MFAGTKAGSELRHYIDVTELHVPRPGMEVQTYMKDGQVDNWDLFEKMLDYCYAKVINERWTRTSHLFPHLINILALSFRKKIDNVF